MVSTYVGSQPIVEKKRFLRSLKTQNGIISKGNRSLQFIGDIFRCTEKND